MKSKKKTVEHEELVAAQRDGAFCMENDIDGIGYSVGGFFDDWGFLPQFEFDGVKYKIVPVDGPA